MILFETKARQHCVQWSDREHPRLSMVTFSICASPWRDEESNEMALGITVNEVADSADARQLVCWRRAPHQLITAIRAVDLLTRLQNIDEATLTASYDVMRRERDSSSYKSLSVLRKRHGDITIHRQDILDQPIDNALITNILREGCWWDDNDPNALHVCTWELFQEHSLNKLTWSQHMSVMANNQLSYYKKIATEIDKLPVEESFGNYCKQFGINLTCCDDLSGDIDDFKEIDSIVVRRGQTLTASDDRDISIAFYCSQKNRFTKSFHVGYPVISLQHDSSTTSCDYSIGSVFYRDYHTWVQLSPIDWGSKDNGMPIIVRLSDLYSQTIAFIGISCEANDRNVTIEDRERGYVLLARPRRKFWLGFKQTKEVK